MRLIIGLVALVALMAPSEVLGRLNEAKQVPNDQDERRLPARGGRDGRPQGRGGPPGQSPGQIKKAITTASRGQEKKLQPPPVKPFQEPKIPPGKPVAPLVIKPVEWNEARETVDDVAFMNLLNAQKKYVGYLNQKIEVEAEETTATGEEIAADNEADEAAREEAQAEDDTEKEKNRKKMVAARLKAQAAKERAERARKKALSLEATNESTVETLLEAQESYRAKVNERALKAAKEQKEQVEKDQKENKDKDKTVWRGMKEDALVKSAKAKDEAKKEMLMLPQGCEALEEAQEIILGSREIKLRRHHERLAKLPGRKDLPQGALEEAKALQDEDAALLEVSRKEASMMKEACASLGDDQEFLESRVLKVIENMQKRELAVIDADDALGKYQQYLDEKIEADREAIAAGNEEAEATSAAAKEAAKLRLKEARAKVLEKENLRKKAAQRLVEADNENIEALKSMIEKASEAKEAKKEQKKLSPDQKEAMLILAELQLDQSRREKEISKSETEVVAKKQEELMAILHERFEQEQAMLKRVEADEDAANEEVETTTDKGQKEAAIEKREILTAIRVDAEVAEDLTALQKVTLTEEQESWRETRQMIMDAENWYEELLLEEQAQAEAADTETADDQGTDEN